MFDASDLILVVVLINYLCIGIFLYTIAFWDSEFSGMHTIFFLEVNDHYIVKIYILSCEVTLGATPRRVSLK